MKTIDMRFIIFTGLIFSAWSLMAQEDQKEQLVVPLTDPGNRGQLQVNQIYGDIVVVGYEGDEVIIDATFNPGSENRERSKPTPPGMMRIASNPVKISARENDNMVTVETQSWKSRTDLNIKVPSDFDLELHTVHGILDISSVTGALEVSGVNGAITMDEISGSVVCNTVNGGVEVRFIEVEPDTPMSFVTLNGNVDVTFPASVKISARMKSDQGDIYTDFDMQMKTSERQVKRGGDCSDCNYEITINPWVYGDINNGGAEFTFKNMSGDILIRKRN